MTSEQKKNQRKRQLTIQYMVAVVLIFLVSLSSLVVLELILNRQEGYATVINMSGRQRMLSQKIALLAHEIVAEHRGEGRNDLYEQIHSAVQLMERSHQQLISGKRGEVNSVVLSDTLYNMYFHPPLEVDKLVSDYLAAITALIAEPNAKGEYDELSSLSVTARGALLGGLDAVVKQYEVESTRYTDILKNSALAIFFLMVLLLVLIVIFGFRPMANMVAENESMLKSILDSIPILMDIISKDGTILYQSKFLLDYLGESTVGQKCFEAYKTDQNQCESCPITATEQIADMKITTCFDKLGSGTVIEMTHLSLLFKGEPAFLHTFQDITEQKRTESFLVRAKEEADRASELKSNFLANMSHEIRTPMNAILGFSELALETELTTQQQDYVEKINRSSRSLLGIINEILDFSKIEAGKLSLENRQFSLQEILENITFLFGDKAQEKKVALTTYQHADIPVLLIGDALRLQQVLTNLVSNSLKFTDQGEITVRVDLEALSAQQARLEFSVEDTGIGIANDKLATLFNAFSQADSSTTRKYGGTGLGLAISRQLVELLGGTIEVNSTMGVGTVFRFTVPFELSSTLGQNQEADIREDEIISSIRGAHVLLVEDNHINRQVAEEILKKADITLDVANNGQEALEKILVKEINYDAILMDIQMPIMNGIECVQELRKREENMTTSSRQRARRIPVVAMTANAMQGDREQYLQAGMDDSITKPINRDTLFRVLANCIPKDHIWNKITCELCTARCGQKKEQENEREEDFDDKERNGAGDHLHESLKGIELKQGLARLEGNSELYFRLLSEFATENSSMVKKIQRALEKQDQECAVRLVHTIKGTAGSLGAVELSAASLTLEQAMREGKGTKTQMIQFEEALQQVLHSLGTLTDGQQHDEARREGIPDSDKERRSRLTVELESMLTGKKFQAASKWKELKPLLSGVDASILQQIDRSIGSFDHNTALKLLTALQINDKNRE
jgi:signal transduction histidine kinase/CheY-like chemotaxis protein